MNKRRTYVVQFQTPQGPIQCEAVAYTEQEAVTRLSHALNSAYKMGKRWVSITNYAKNPTVLAVNEAPDIGLPPTKPVKIDRYKKPKKEKDMSNEEAKRLLAQTAQTKSGKAHSSAGIKSSLPKIKPLLK